MRSRINKSYIGNWEWRSDDRNIRFSFYPQIGAEFWWTLKCELSGQAQYGDI